MKVLVIEDQEKHWENFLISLIGMCNIAREEIERARWYGEAYLKIEENQYDIIFLDHVMPQHDPGCTDISDYRTFTNQTKGVGYSLMHMIEKHQKHAVVVGTSSANSFELRNFQVPSLKISKASLFHDVPEIIEQISLMS